MGGSERTVADELLTCDEDGLWGIVSERIGSRRGVRYMYMSVNEGQWCARDARDVGVELAVMPGDPRASGTHVHRSCDPMRAFNTRQAGSSTYCACSVLIIGALDGVRWLDDA